MEYLLGGVWTITAICLIGLGFVLGESNIIPGLETINEIKNVMERWHLGREEDFQTLEEINRILVKNRIG